MIKNEQQLNMQIPELEDAMQKLQKMTLLDDFLFDVATVNLENCKIIIELSMGIRIKEIRWREGQKIIHNLPGKRGIRMDFYVEDVDGNIFNVEMQKRNEGNIPKRMRFYQALLDAPLLQSGEKSFDNLNQTYIIVICGFDLYKQGLYRYTFENRCIERPNILMGDECTKIVLNTRGTNDQEVEQSLIDFLHYIETNSLEDLPADCDDRLKYLHNNLRLIKSDKQMGVSYMKMEERDRLIREEGEEIGKKLGEEIGKKLGEQIGKKLGEQKKIISLVLKKFQKGKSVEIIAEELEETPDAILPIYTAISEQDGNCDIDSIYHLLIDSVSSNQDL